MESGCCFVVDVELSNMKATVYMVQTLNIQTLVVRLDQCCIIYMSVTPKIACHHTCCASLFCQI